MDTNEQGEAAAAVPYDDDTEMFDHANAKSIDEKDMMWAGYRGLLLLSAEKVKNETSLPPPPPLPPHVPPQAPSMA